jgi:hypothetical protein
MPMAQHHKSNTTTYGLDYSVIIPSANASNLPQSRNNGQVAMQTAPIVNGQFDGSNRFSQT